jgi:hypothetical protein
MAETADPMRFCVTCGQPVDPPFGEWQSIETAPQDGTPVLLFARAKHARASIRIVGWFRRDIGWIEGCFMPNQPTGIVPTHWMPLPDFPDRALEPPP